ncbi:O-succinylbenzoic acid--CoA ligase [Klenkia marina]|uniref:O-succinylbenzoic acid--CoA ligase n=1 Tax=Klenkia marina TaxID=1960309 RepID=A0A1G4XZP4_9ACTN|nr:AMP-binding protein [Klenkia marina]SCX46560.1 O-succinylbenzoic acid--CoA ligase [Klenkia marina]
MARQLSLVPAPPPGPAVLTDVWPHVRAALDGDAPLAVVPADPGPAARAAAVLRPEVPLEDGADLVVLTSGSTGDGRGVLLTAAALRASATATLARLGGPGGWVLALPVSAIAGLQVLVRSALAGRPPAVLGPGDRLADALVRTPGERRYTALVPTQLRRFLAAEPEALRGFDAVLVGGAATDPALLAQARDAGVAVVTTYGMSETSGGCVYDGAPLDGVGVRVTAQGIELSGAQLAQGYRLDPAATAEAFVVDGAGTRWFRTRDAGAWQIGTRRAYSPLDPAVAEQARLVVEGRLDDVVVTGGVNVAPPAVEAALREHPDVADAVVLGRPDAEWGARVVAAVVPSPGAVPDLAVLRAWVSERLGPPAAPKELHVLDAVPVLHTGKPDRRAVTRLIEGT